MALREDSGWAEAEARRLASADLEWFSSLSSARLFASSDSPEPEQPAFAPAPSLDGGASQRRVEQVSPAHSSASPSVDGPTLGGDKLGGELAGSESTGDTTAYSSSAPHGSGSSASRHSRSEGIVLLPLGDVAVSPSPVPSIDEQLPPLKPAPIPPGTFDWDLPFFSSAALYSDVEAPGRLTMDR